jgi:phosphopantothenoylcysteine decarboxylase / phosphopantothenate---cysteine ligase
MIRMCPFARTAAVRYSHRVQDQHPSLDITGTRSSRLSGKTIIHAMCGSVAVARAPELARVLMRQGARVVPVMSAEATRLLHPNLMHWSTGEVPVTQLTGAIEHVALAGNTPTRADLMIIAPATANTIGKLAAGIDDGPVTTFATTAIGEGLPLIVVPAMHEPMYRHPIVSRNLETLREIGVQIVMPRIQEGKAKVADSDAILELVVDVFAQRGDEPSGRSALAGVTVLITAGRTVEYLDPIRVITNNSSGKMGMALAQAARDAGATVTVVYGKGSAEPPANVRVVRVDTAEAMRHAVQEELQTNAPRVVIAAAAVGDWRPVSKSPKKIATHEGERITVELEPTPKIIDAIKREHPETFLVAFRAQHDLSLEELLADARARADRAAADLIAVNDVARSGAGFETDTNEMYLLGPGGFEEHLPLQDKLGIAQRIISVIAARL